MFVIAWVFVIVPRLFLYTTSFNLHNSMRLVQLNFMCFLVNSKHLRKK